MILLLQDGGTTALAVGEFLNSFLGQGRRSVKEYHELARGNLLFFGNSLHLFDGRDSL
jgi:hypothetical protein